MLDYLRIMLNARLAKMDERGASAVEYGLLIAGIAALIVAVVFAFGGVISDVFTNTCDSGRRRRRRHRLLTHTGHDGRRPGPPGLRPSAISGTTGPACRP